MTKQSGSSSNSVQLWIAIIGLIGTLVGAVFANWDKIFPKPSLPSASALAPSIPGALPVTATTPLEIKEYADPAPVTSGEVRPEPPPLMPAVEPSFDCSKATYPSERIVCSSPELAVLDLAMSNAYREAAARAGTKERKADLRKLQNRWLRKDREACADVACLRDLYQQRISELNAVQR